MCLLSTGKVISFGKNIYLNGFSHFPSTGFQNIHLKPKFNRDYFPSKKFTH